MSALPPRASLFPAGSLAPATAKSLWADFYDAIANFFGSAGHGFDGALLAAPRRATFGGTADAITSTLAPAPTAYVTGMRVTGLLPGANTITNPAMNLNALGNKTIKKRSGTGAKVALVVGDYNGTLPFEFEYDGTDMILLNPLVPARASVASAATLDLSATSGNLLITGTTAVTAVTLASGQTRYATADAALPLTHGASLIIQGGVSYTCEAGDGLQFIGEPAGVVRVMIDKISGTPVVPPVQIFTTPYDSGNQTISLGGALTLAHSLGAVPKMVQFFAVCLEAEHNYSIGDEVVLSSMGNTFAGAGSSSLGGFVATIDATNIWIGFASAAGPIYGFDKTTRALVGFTNAKWAFIARAYA